MTQKRFETISIIVGYPSLYYLYNLFKNKIDFEKAHK